MLVFVLTQENALSQRLHLKPTERAKVSLQNGARDVQNSPPFARWACFYATITGNFERFQCCNFETNFLKNGSLF